MINLILVDDDASVRSREKNVINRVLLGSDVEYNIQEFSNFNNELKHVIDTNEPKIYILDIDLGNGGSGLDIGKYIRNNDWDSEIIYITSHDKMFERVFRSIFKVFDFIEKFDSLESRLESDLRKILLKKWDKAKFTYINNRVNLEIFYDDIYYIYRDTVERKCVIKTGKGNAYYVSKNLSDILNELDGRFAQVHRACIVNKDKVNLYNWSKGFFILDNNEKVELLSKNYRIDD